MIKIIVGYVYDKLYHLEDKHYYCPEIIINYQYSGNDLPRDIYRTFNDMISTTIGFAPSTGIRYRIISTIGIGVSANGLFASLSKLKYPENFPGEKFSRKINRIGFSAGLDFNF